MAFSATARADVVITSFEDFFEDALYASWASPEAEIDWGTESYSVTASGYGSNGADIGGLGVTGEGNTHEQLAITLEGPAEADGHLGPIITLVDADGTRNNYAWYGQLLGDHLLTMPVDAPTWNEAAGTTAGLDLNAIDHLHLQLDPGGFGATGQYTARFHELSLITIEIAPGDFDHDGDVDGRDFLVWQRGESPDSLTAADLADWQNAYGTPPASAIAIPEPESLGMLLLAAASGMLIRRPL